MVGVYCLEYMLTSYGDMDSYVTALVLLLVSLYHWRVLDGGTWQGFTGGVFAAIIGAVTEHTLCEIGTMWYVTKDIGRIPVWLPLIYFASAQSWGQVCRRLLYVRHYSDV